MSTEHSAITEPRLPGCPPPYAGESLNGYLLRLSALNGYSGLGMMLSLAGYRGTPLVYAPGYGNKMAAFLGMSPDALRRMSYETGSSASDRRPCSFFGESIPRYLVDATKPKICPACVRETGFLHALWDLTPVVACHRHGTMLLDHCPGCARPLTWLRSGPTQCFCGHDFSNAVTSATDGHLVSVMRLIAEKAGFDAPSDLHNDLPPRLKGLSLHGLLELLAVLGWWNAGLGKESIRNFRKTEPSERPAIITAGMEALLNWPGAFHEFLGRMMRQAPHAGGKYDLRRDLGNLYLLLFPKSIAGHLGFVQEEAKVWRRKWRSTPVPLGGAVRRRPRVQHVTSAPEEVVSADVPFHRASAHWLRLSSAAGIGAAAVRRNMERGTLSFADAGAVLYGRKRVKVIPSQQAREQIDLERGRRVGASGAYAMLGVTKRMFPRLVKHGVLTPDSSFVDDGRKDVMYLVEEIEDLLARLGNAAIPLRERHPDDDLISFTDASGAFTCDEFTTKDLLERLISGQIACWTTEIPCTLGTILVRRKDVYGSVLDLARGGDQDLLTINEAAERLGKNPATVRAMIRSGRVDARTVIVGPRSYLMVFWTHIPSAVCSVTIDAE